MDIPFSGTMQAKINGELKVFAAAGGMPTSPICEFGICPDCNPRFNSIFSSGLGAPDPQEIHIRFINPPGFGSNGLYGTYSIRDGDDFILYEQWYPCDETQTYIEEEGSFTITSTGNNTYKGTFSFTASNNCGENKVFITEGEFEIEKERKPLCN